MDARVIFRGGASVIVIMEGVILLLRKLNISGLRVDVKVVHPLFSGCICVLKNS